MKTLVLGATNNPDRYAYLAVERLLNSQIPVIPVGVKKGEVLNLTIQNNKEIHSDVHTITLYIGPSRHEEWEDYILETRPKRVIFNPGTENEQLQKQLRKNNIEAVEGCTLVMLAAGTY